MPCIPLDSKRTVAKHGVCYPMMGLGLDGPGYKIGQKEECWHYPQCCTKDHCPIINATREWLKMGGWRLDTGYPWGDGGSNQCPDGKGHHFACDPEGIKQAMKQSGLKREDIFVIVKSGFAGPMGPIGQKKGQAMKQAWHILDWLGIDYADVYMQHEGDLGTAGHDPMSVCKYPTQPKCRIDCHKSCIGWMKSGHTKACGVSNWELEWLKQIKNEGILLPAVVENKYHLHYSVASKDILEMKEFCDANGIVFNAGMPLGRADWTTFETSVGTTTMFEKPAVLDIAKRIGKAGGRRR